MINLGASELRGIHSAGNPIKSVRYRGQELWSATVDFSSGYWSSGDLPRVPTNPEYTDPPTNRRGSQRFSEALSSNGFRLIRGYYDHYRSTSEDYGAEFFTKTSNGWSKDRELRVRDTSFTFGGTVSANLALPEGYSVGYRYALIDGIAASDDWSTVLVHARLEDLYDYRAPYIAVAFVLRWSNDSGSYVQIGETLPYSWARAVSLFPPCLSQDGSRMLLTGYNVAEFSGIENDPAYKPISVFDISSSSLSLSATIPLSEFGVYRIWSIKLSGDGQTIVVGDSGKRIYSSEGSDVDGAVGVVKFDGQSWQRAGSVLTSVVASSLPWPYTVGDIGRSSGGWPDLFGQHIAISHDGSRLVSSSPTARVGFAGNHRGVVEVFEFADGSWESMGDTVRSPRFGFGYGVAISGDGAVMAAHSRIYDGSYYPPSEKPSVTVHHWDGTSWNQAGDLLLTPHDTVERAYRPQAAEMSLSRNGGFIAVGWPWLNGDGYGTSGSLYTWNSTG